jgi:zinc transport system substrate-binding protein
VLASLVPQETLARRVGGDLVTVQVMVAPGRDPHSFEPTPRRIAEVSSADLYWRIGVPFEAAWLPRILATNPALKVLDARDGVRLIPSEPHAPQEAHGEGDQDHAHGGSPGGADPHIWTSPPIAKSMAAGLRDALSALRPGDAAVFAANYERLAAELDALDAGLRARLAPLSERRFLVFHPAWGYFAETYGLEQVPIERRGKEPGARSLAQTIDLARAAGIRVVLTQPQSNPRPAEQVASAIGARVATVDPLGADYFGTLRRLAGLIAGERAP